MVTIKSLKERQRLLKKKLNQSNYKNEFPEIVTIHKSIFQARKNLDKILIFFYKELNKINDKLQPLFDKRCVELHKELVEIESEITLRQQKKIKI